ncbi:hypothetical protein [Pseudomonas putida]|uniref:hypothetical protein n=1 Tax=Pseudomonas putida TaxID=303 RepID=UPI0038230502
MEVAVDSVSCREPSSCVAVQEVKAGDGSDRRADGGAGGNGPGFHFIVPTAFRQSVISQVAWTTWYGSAKALAEVADTLMRLRDPLLHTVRSMATLNVPKGMSAPTGHIVLSYLGIAEHRELVEEVMGEAFARVDLFSKLEYNLGQILGNERRDKLRFSVQTAPAEDLVNTIQQSFPVLTSLFHAGAFSRQLAMPLLYLGALSERLIDTNARPSQNERVRIEMAITVLFLELPPYIPGLIFSTCPHIIKLFPDQVMQVNHLMVAARGPLDPCLPLSSQMSTEGFSAIVQELVAFNASSQPRSKQVIPRLLEMAEASALSLRNGENALSIAYGQFCEDLAVPRWKSLLEALGKHAESMELQFDHKLFPRDLVGRSIEQPRSVSIEAITLLRGLIALNNAQLDAEGFIQRADKKLAKARELEAQISGLSVNLTASAMLKIASLAQAGSDEIMANREWFKAELEGLVPLVRGWQRFYEDWDRLLRKSPPGTNKQPTALSVVEVLSVAKPAELPGNDALQAQVAGLQEALSAKNAENSEMRAELYSLRTFKENLSLPMHRPEPLELNMGLMRRIVARDGITPLDVLLYIEAIAEGRVVILDSAWKSAKDASTFQNTERMLEVLDAMVFPYYESLMAGKPDATARMILGSSYSANESETVSTNRRLRGLREFEYQEKVYFFERHLKAGSGTGLEGMRIHFDIIDKKVVIAYAGPHLECASTN